VGFWYIFHTQPITLPADLQTIENDVRSEEKTILMRKCSGCLIITAFYIIGTVSKNGVLGGDKHKFITIIWGGAPSPDSTSSQSQYCFSAGRIASKHAVSNRAYVHGK